MRICARLLCVLTLIATPAAAQSTTEDGIRALLRGEYQAAARILRPLADDAERPDPVAQFFLAFLYDTGQGVTRDGARACGLFLSASRRVHPFTEQSAAIAGFMRDQLGTGASLFCVADERWQGGPPQSFVMGPGHEIVFADTSVTVRNGDREHRTPMVLQVGAAYLPIRYTNLAVTRPAVARRHFFEWFVWTPDTTLQPSSWTLGWMLSEVVGDAFVPITHEKNLAIVDGTTWPASYDVSKLVTLRVNASGEAEFTIASRAGSRTEVMAPRGGH